MYLTIVHINNIQQISPVSNDNLTKQIIELWEEQMTEYYQNPENIKFLSQQFMKFEEILQKSHEQQTNSNLPDNWDDKLNDLHIKLDRIAERIDRIENTLRDQKYSNT